MKLFGLGLIVGASFVALTCADMGEETGHQAALIATPSSVTVGPGQSQNVSISNGTPPYAIAEVPNSGLATASFLNPNTDPAMLVITGVTIASAAGSTSVKVKDSSPSPEREVSVTITKTP